MAQRKNVRFQWFDEYWRERVKVAAKALLDLEDSWLKGGSRDFPIDRAAAILFHVIRFDFYCAAFLNYTGVRSDDLLRRSVDEWYESVDSPDSELNKLSPALNGPARLRIIESVRSIINEAAESWGTNGPNSPTCDEVVRDICDFLVRSRSLKLRRT